MASVAFIGRLMVAFLFLSSGAQKLSSFNLSDGGPTMDLMVRRFSIKVEACRSCCANVKQRQMDVGHFADLPDLGPRWNAIVRCAGA